MPKPVVVIANDDRLLAEIIVHKFAARGFEVHSAGDGNSALELIRSLKPDLAILDLMMPGRDGFELLREIKASRDLSRIPVIVLSARNVEEEIVAALDLGVADYVTKPVSLAELLARASRLLRERVAG